MTPMTSTVVEAKWPKEPYKGFSYYTFEDTLLFVGRDHDVDDCAAYLAEPKTRTLLLHGRTGCGKSSFLRAGLIPALESRGFGFVFLRRHEGERPVLIRCTADPMTRIAEELFWFTDHPWRYETAIDSRLIDVSNARLGKNDIHSFAEACSDPYFLMDVLKEISGELLHTLVIILDQAEEAITQADTRAPFFDFLKLFNGTNLDVKLVIALRTERFGEFFGYLHFGASVITDVKQYFLQGLDRTNVRQAIELPTLTTPIDGQKPPFDVYGFTYEPGLIDRIVSDLFSAPPSGGILPLMQVVCRGLYNEVRHDLPPPRIITLDRYNSGGGVSGRVDKQIGQSLRAAIRGDMPWLRDLDMAERKWRAGLYRLVRTQPDGTVGTDIKTEAELNLILRESQVTGDIGAMLADLADPEVLLLRSFKVISAESGSEIVLYSLGHDAIGLVLRQWMLREDEAEKRRDAEVRERQRAKIFISVGTAGLAVFFASLLYIGVLTNQRKSQDADVLRSFAEMGFRSDPGIAATAAINASIVADGIWLGSQKLPTLTTLASIAATVPDKIIRSRLAKPGLERALSGGFVFPQSKKYLFWRGDEGAELVSWDGQERSKVDSASLFGMQKPSGSVFLLNATEVAPDRFLLRFGGESEFISVLKNGRVVKIYDAQYFLGLSKDVQSRFEKERQGSVERSSRPLHLGIDSNIVYLSQWNTTSITVTAFFLEGDDGDGAGHFRVGALVSEKASPANTRIWSSAPGIVMFFTYVLASDTSGADRGRRQLDSLRAYDFRTEEQRAQIWSLETSEVSVIKDCLKRFDESLDACVIRFFDQGLPNHLLFVVPPQAKKADAPEPSSEAFGTLVIIDIEARRSLSVDIGQLVQSAQGAAHGPRRRRIDFSRIAALGGTFGSVLLAISEGQMVDVYRIEGVQPQFVGTYTSVSPAENSRILFTEDGKTMALIDSSAVQLWDISQFVSSKSEALAKAKSGDELIQIICSSGLPQPVGENEWRDLIGLNIRPSKPCGNQ